MVIGSKSRFVEDRCERTRRCSECGKKIPAGSMSLIGIRRGRVVKRVCSEECRKNFDDSYWQGRADWRERRNETH